MTSAEVKFPMAEATVKKWNVGSALAEDLYKQGVRAAMDFATDNYGCTATTDAEFDAFIQDKGAFGHTDNQKLEAINTIVLDSSLHQSCRMLGKRASFRLSEVEITGRIWVRTIPHRWNGNSGTSLLSCIGIFL